MFRRPLLRTSENIWSFVIIFDSSNITAIIFIRRKAKMRTMELSGVNFSTQGSELEISCFDQISLVSVCNEPQIRNFV